MLVPSVPRDLRYDELCEITGNELGSAEYLQHFGIVPMEMPCPKPDCEHKEMKLIDRRDGDRLRAEWRRSAIDAVPFLTRQDNRNRLPLRKILRIIFQFAIDAPIRSAEFQTRINKNSLIQWYQKCQQVCDLAYEQADRASIVGGMIQPDESIILGIDKYRRFKPVKGQTPAALSMVIPGEPVAKKPCFPNPKQRYVSPGEAWWRTTQRFNHRCNPAIFEEFLRLIARIDWHAPIGALIAAEDDDIDYSIFKEADDSANSTVGGGGSMDQHPALQQQQQQQQQLPHHLIDASTGQILATSSSAIVTSQQQPLANNNRNNNNNGVVVSSVSSGGNGSTVTVITSTNNNGNRQQQQQQPHLIQQQQQQHDHHAHHLHQHQQQRKYETDVVDNGDDDDDDDDDDDQPQGDGGGGGPLNVASLVVVSSAEDVMHPDDEYSTQPFEPL